MPVSTLLIHTLWHASLTNIIQTELAKGTTLSSQHVVDLAQLPQKTADERKYLYDDVLRKI